MSTSTSGAPASSRRIAHQVVTRALDWLHTHSDRGAMPPESEAALADPDGFYKPLGELALAASLVLREGMASASEQQAARDLLDFGWTQLGSGDLLYERQMRFPMMTDPLEMYTHFARAGYRHERLHTLVAHLGGLATHRGSEMMPNRRMAVANAARVAEVERETDWSKLIDATWLGHTPEPWMIDWMTAYCMTHTVFHATDWGADPEGLPVRVREYLAHWLPAWMDIWAEIHEWDLLAELIIVDASLPRPQCDPEIWERLAAAQHPDGLVPRDGNPVDEDPDQAYLDNRHTTIVAAIAGTLALSRHGDTVVL
ncbi:DUF6895 family protein [Streptomyces inusitatus]|uniref:DUF6895 family protein n=1 Tax=Streptomyces inusitatus TaxID=68221 RepID=UPI001E2A130E|nr:hypothetical protein [Streptomyces inusitatus]